MRIYLDASVLVPLLTDDPLTKRADAIRRELRPVAVVSDFAAAEFASALGRRVRVRSLTVTEARAAFSDLDEVLVRSERVYLLPADVKSAETILRRLDLPLRTPDALHIAMAQRVGSPLATFDAQMGRAARSLGLEVHS